MALLVTKAVCALYVPGVEPAASLLHVKTGRVHEPEPISCEEPQVASEAWDKFDEEVYFGGHALVYDPIAENLIQP